MKARLVLLLAVLLLTGSVQAQTYVVIGDSLAFGFQKDKFYDLFFSGAYDPAAFNTGFADVIHNYLRPYWPNLKTVNFSCPGETTNSLINGGCPIHTWLFALPLHQDYPGATPQINAVIQYLQEHPSEVVFITVTIGGNDILNLFGDCANDITCAEQGFHGMTAQAAQNLGLVIQVLKILSPQSIVLYTNVPDPYLFSAPGSVEAFDIFNAAMATAATNAGARVVDWSGALKQYDEASFCMLTFVCQAPSYDIHPTDIGYHLLAGYTLQALFQPTPNP